MFRVEANVWPDVAAKPLREHAGNFAKALPQRAAHRAGIVGTDDVIGNDSRGMAGVMPDHAEHLPLRPGEATAPLPAHPSGLDGFGAKTDACQPEPIGAAQGRKRPIAAAVDGMVQIALQNHPGDFRRRLPQHLQQKTFSGSGNIIARIALPAYPDARRPGRSREQNGCATPAARFRQA